MWYKKILIGLQFVLLFNSFLPAQSPQAESGIKLIKYEKFSEAKKYFSSLLNSPASAEAYFYLGQISFMEDKMDSAEAFYQKGIQANVEFPLNYAGLVKVNIAEKNSSDAESNQNKALEIGDEENPLVYIVLSEAYSNPKIRNYDKAIDLLRTALKINPKSVQAMISQGNIYLSTARGTEAIRSSESILDIEPGNAEALTLKAKVYSLINNFAGAISLLNEAVTSDPLYAPAYRELADIYSTQKDYAKASESYSKYIESSEITAEKQKRYASFLYLNKEYTKAINILEDIIKSEPDNASSIRILAYSYLRLENIEQSKSYFQKLFEIPSTDYLPTDYENYADLLSKTGNDSLAVDYYFKVVELDSTRKDILGKTSVLYFKNKNWNGVIASLTKKGELTAQEYFDLGKAYYFNGDKAVADVMESLNIALSLSYEQQAEVRLALLHYQKYIADGQPVDAAIETTIQKIEPIINNGQKAGWASLKNQWAEEVKTKIQQDYVKADSAFSMLASKVPELAIAHFWRARVNTNFDPESEQGLAKPFYEEFINVSKEDTAKYKKELIEAYSYLGYYYFLKTDNANSKTYWQKVYAIDPNNKQALEALANIK